MHRCFLVPELVQHICEEINNSRARGRARKTLVALAQTRKLFQEPALNLVWHTLERLEPLVKCLPSDVWELRKTHGGVFVLGFKRAISPADWPRFKENAQRVRVLTIQARDVRRRIEGHVYRMLGVMALEKSLLPNLRKLGWSERDDQIFPFFRMFLGPQLQELTVTLDGPLTRLPLLSNLRTQCPNLIRLDLLQGFSEDNNRADHIQTLPITLLHGWHQLQELSVRKLTSEALICLATLPNLRAVDFATSLKMVPTGFPIPPDNPPFPCLQRLSLTCRHLDFCTSLINIMSRRALKDIDIRASSALPSTWKKFFITLKNNCAWDALEKFSIVHNTEYEEHDRDLDDGLNRFFGPVSLMDDSLGDVSLGDIIEPMFSFSFLTTVKLSPLRPFKISYNDIEALALAWPRITRLCLKSWLSAFPEPYLSLQGLVPLAQHCQRLEDLSIFVDARVIPPIETTRHVFNETLRSLCISNSPINDPKKVAIFLTRIFPNILELHSCGFADCNGGELDEDEDWGEVDSLLKVLVTARAEERQRWALKDAGSS